MRTLPPPVCIGIPHGTLDRSESIKLPQEARKAVWSREKPGLVWGIIGGDAGASGMKVHRMARGIVNRGSVIESAIRMIGLASVLAFALVGLSGGCTCETNLIPLPSGVVMRIENQTGLPLEAEASFINAEKSVRQTSRTLGASGPEAIESILATEATVVTVTVRVGAGVGPLVRLAPGYVLREETYRAGVDFEAGDEIVLIVTLPDAPIPDPIVDCNQNGISDALDIAKGLSIDCDQDGQPDECQTFEDLDENVVPDVCEFWCDLNGDEVVDSADVVLFVAIVLDTPYLHEGEPTTSSGVETDWEYDDDVLFRADFNGDKRVDGGDTQGFLECVLESGL